MDRLNGSIDRKIYGQIDAETDGHLNGHLNGLWTDMI